MTRDKVLDRIQKLMALGSSSNANEAANAAAQAQRLMEKHRINQAELLEENEDVDDIIEKIDNGDVVGKRRQTRWKWSLAWAVAHANNCKPYIRYDQNKMILVMIGYRNDANAALYIYRFLVKEIDRLAKSLNNGGGKSWSDSFRKGAVDTIRNRLKETKQEVLNTASSKALVRLNQSLANIEDWMKSARLSYVNATSTKLGRFDAYIQGKRAGNNIRLNSSTAISSGPRALKSS